METTYKKRLQMFRRVRALLVGHEDNPALAVSITALDGVILRLAEHATAQEAHWRQWRQATDQKLQLARVLRTDLFRPVALLGGVVFPAGLEDGASLRRAVQMPLARDYQGLVTAADGLARAVSEHQELFVQAGLPADHLQRLREGARALEESIGVAERDAGRRSAATAGMRNEAKRGHRILKVVNALVRPLLRSDPARLAEWDQALRSPTRIRGVDAVEEAPTAAGAEGKSVDATVGDSVMVEVLPPASTSSGSDTSARAA